MNILVLGVGNVLLGDEGVGIRGVFELERRYRLPSQVQLLDGGTAGIELLSFLQGKDCLLILDAMKSGRPPGTVARFEGDEVPAVFRTRISPHQLGLSDLLAAARLLDDLPKRLVLFGIEPKRIQTGIGLSRAVWAGLEEALEKIVAELGAAGCPVRRRTEIRCTPQTFFDDMEGACAIHS